MLRPQIHMRGNTHDTTNGNSFQPASDSGRTNPLPNGYQTGTPNGVFQTNNEKTFQIPQPYRTTFVPYLPWFGGLCLLLGIICLFVVKRHEQQVKEKYRVAMQKQKTSECNAVWDAFFSHPDSIRKSVDDFPPQAYRQNPKP